MRKLKLMVILSATFLNAGLISCTKEKPEQKVDEFKLEKPEILVQMPGGAGKNGSGSVTKYEIGSLDIKQIRDQDILSFPNLPPDSKPLQLRVQSFCLTNDGKNLIADEKFELRSRFKFKELMPPQIYLNPSDSVCSWILTANNSVGSTYRYRISQLQVAINPESSDFDLLLNGNPILSAQQAGQQFDLVELAKLTMPAVRGTLEEQKLICSRFSTRIEKVDAGSNQFSELILTPDWKATEANASVDEDPRSRYLLQKCRLLRRAVVGNLPFQHSQTIWISMPMRDLIVNLEPKRYNVMYIGGTATSVFGTLRISNPNKAGVLVSLPQSIKNGVRYEIPQQMYSKAKPAQTISFKTGFQLLSPLQSLIADPEQFLFEIPAQSDVALTLRLGPAEYGCHAGGIDNYYLQYYRTISDTELRVTWLTEATDSEPEPRQRQIQSTMTYKVKTAIPAGQIDQALAIPNSGGLVDAGQAFYCNP